MDGLSGHIGGSHIKADAQTYFRDLINNEYTTVTEFLFHQPVGVIQISFLNGFIN
jgi:hypothetical protein